MINLTRIEVAELGFAFETMGFMFGVLWGWKLSVKHIASKAWQYAEDSIEDFRVRVIGEIDDILTKSDPVGKESVNHIRARVSRLSKFPSWYSKILEDVKDSTVKTGKEFSNMELDLSGIEPVRNTTRVAPGSFDPAPPKFDAVKSQVEADCLKAFHKLIDAFIAANRMVPDALRALQTMKDKLTAAETAQKGGTGDAQKA